MRGWTIGWLVWIVATTAWGLPVWPVFTTPEAHQYLALIPELIASAEREVLVALSDCRQYEDGASDPLLAALTGAVARGVEVWVLMERRAEDLPLPEQQLAFHTLSEAGCRVLWDDPQVTLHSKFLVLDARVVVVGSSHWTYSALKSSVQVDLVIESAELAEIARAFFWLLWEGELEAEAALPLSLIHI